MSTIEVDEKTAKRLDMLAADRGMSVADYLRSLADAAYEREPAPREFDFDLELRELTFAGPTLPTDFSRADIYRDHD